MDKIKTFDFKKIDTKCIRVYIENYLIDILQAFGQEEQMSMSEIVNSALDSYFLKQGCNKYFYK